VISYIASTDTQKHASYLDLDLDGGRLKTKLYDKLDDFTFPILNKPVKEVCLTSL
jgi:hypothetical protein